MNSEFNEGGILGAVSEDLMKGWEKKNLPEGQTLLGLKIRNDQVHKKLKIMVILPFITVVIFVSVIILCVVMAITLPERNSLIKFGYVLLVWSIVLASIYLGKYYRKMMLTYQTDVNKYEKIMQGFLDDVCNIAPNVQQTDIDNIGEINVPSIRSRIEVLATIILAHEDLIDKQIVNNPKRADPRYLWNLLSEYLLCQSNIEKAVATYNAKFATENPINAREVFQIAEEKIKMMEKSLKNS